MLLHFTGPPVPITARMYSTPQTMIRLTLIMFLNVGNVAGAEAPGGPKRKLLAGFENLWRKPRSDAANAYAVKEVRTPYYYRKRLRQLGSERRRRSTAQIDSSRDPHQRVVPY
eukprot:8148628-Pyramimonas_sp.AAC.2